MTTISFLGPSAAFASRFGKRAPREDVARPAPDMRSVPENASLWGRILLRKVLNLAPITRELQRKALLPDEQSSEANLITGELPLRYKSGERQAVAMSGGRGIFAGLSSAPWPSKTSG